MFVLVKKIKSLIQGTMIDKYLRLFICYLSKYYYKNVNQKKKFTI